MKVAVRGKEFKTFSNAGFWNQVSGGTWEPETFRALLRYLDKNHSYIDVGAWIGPTVMYGCQLSKFCYAIEPDPVAFGVLKANIALNHFTNVSIHEVAIADIDGELEMASPNTSLGDSCTSFLFRGEYAVKVPAMTLSHFFESNKIVDCNFLKIDTEGAEVLIIPSSRELLNALRPTIYLGLHAPSFAQKDSYFGVLIASLQGMYDEFINAATGETKRIDELTIMTGWDNVILEGRK